MKNTKSIPKIKPVKFVTDENGNKTEVLIPYASYCEIMESFQDIVDAALIDEVRNEPLISWEEVRRMREVKKS